MTYCLEIIESNILWIKKIKTNYKNTFGFKIYFGHLMCYIMN